MLYELFGIQIKKALQTIHDVVKSFLNIAGKYKFMFFLSVSDKLIALTDTYVLLNFNKTLINNNFQ